ncbi:MAG: hypothetical protein GY757_52980 [bacterium]|nr:hypothetical protein [bacterium]
MATTTTEKGITMRKADLDKFENDILSAPDKKSEVVICKSWAEKGRGSYKLGTVKFNYSQMRKVLKNIRDNHHALKHFKLTDAEYDELNYAYQQSVCKKADDPIKFDDEKFIDVSIKLIEDFFSEKHNSYMKLALGLAGLTGRRIYSEILFFGKFEKINCKEFSIMFSGQAKTKKDDRPPYEIPILADSEFIFESWVALRDFKHFFDREDGKAIFDLSTNAANISMKRHDQIFRKNKSSLTRIDKSKKTMMSKSMGILARKCFKDAFPGYAITPKDLRSACAEICFRRFKINGSRNTYFCKILGHRELDIQTAESYKVFDIDPIDPIVAFAERLK